MAAPQRLSCQYCVIGSQANRRIAELLSASASEATLKFCKEIRFRGDNGTDGVLSLVRGKDVWPVLQRMNGVASVIAQHGPAQELAQKSVVNKWEFLIMASYLEPGDGLVFAHFNLLCEVAEPTFVGGQSWPTVIVEEVPF